MGAKIAHFGTEPGMMKSSSTMTRIITIKQRERADVGLLKDAGQRDGNDAGQVAVVEERR